MGQWLMCLSHHCKQVQPYSIFHVARYPSWLQRLHHPYHSAILLLQLHVMKTSIALQTLNLNIKQHLINIIKRWTHSSSTEFIHFQRQHKLHSPKIYLFIVFMLTILLRKWSFSNPSENRWVNSIPTDINTIGDTSS